MICLNLIGWQDVCRPITVQSEVKQAKPRLHSAQYKISSQIYSILNVFQQEEEEHEEGHESDSDDEETVLYNPKNLPLGWDGKVPHLPHIWVVHDAKL